MLGAIVGDIVGSTHEFIGTKTKVLDFVTDESFATDDSLLTIAVARCILDDAEYVPAFHEMVARFPDAGWGHGFLRWAERRDTQPYNSYGNGSAMRVSPVAFAFESEPEVLAEAERAAAVTHNHPEGIKGAQATALAVFLARQGESKVRIRREVSARFGYDMNRTVDDIRPTYRFNEICQTTVPESIIAFLDSTDFEDAIRNSISLGGDADTLAAITGPIAQAHYGRVPDHARAAARHRLPSDLWQIVERFEQQYACR